MAEQQNEKTADLEEAKKNMREFLQEQEQAYKAEVELVKKLRREEVEEVKNTNPYAVSIEQMKQAEEEITDYIGNYKDAKDKVLEIDKWYAREYEKIAQNNSNLSKSDKAEAISGLSAIYNSKFASTENDVWEQRGEKIGSILQKEFGKILTNYQNFGDGMKNITKNLYEYIIQEAVNAMLLQVLGIKVMNSVKNALSSSSSSGGISSSVFGLVRGAGRIFGLKFHSGGIMPAGANTEIPGTEEQLALLKGGERILSPSENTEYNNNAQNGSSPVVFNNFNIKAWDSKDVQKYLLENKQLLNSITYEGIKNNSNQLRQMVRNA